MQTQTFTNAIATFGMNSVASSTYATAHATALGVNNVNDQSVGGIANSLSVNYFFYRFWFHFDTSAIPTGSSIISAFLRLPGTSTSNNNTNSDTIGVYQSTVSSNTSLTTGDWNNYGSTLLGSIAMASYNSSGNNDIALNSSGIALISDSGYTKIMCMTTQDHASTPPTGYNNQTFSTTGLVLSVTFSPPFQGAMI